MPKPAAILLLAACLLLPAFAAVPAAASRAPISISVILSPTQQTVNASATEGVEVVYNGTVTVDAPPLVRVVVELEGECENGWPVSVLPVEVVFPSGGGSTPFTTRVAVPANATNTTTVVHSGGKATGAGASVKAETGAGLTVIGVAGTPPGGGPHTVANPGSSTAPGFWAIAGPAVVVAAVVAVALILYRSRRK